MDIISTSRQCTQQEINEGGYSLLAKLPKVKDVDFHGASRFAFTIWEIGQFKTNKAKFYIATNTDCKFYSYDEFPEIDCFVYLNPYDEFELYAKCNNYGNTLYLTLDFGVYEGFFNGQSYNKFNTLKSSLIQDKIINPSLYFKEKETPCNNEISLQNFTKILEITMNNNYTGFVGVYDIISIADNENKNVGGRIILKARRGDNRILIQLDVLFKTEEFKKENINIIATKNSEKSISFFLENHCSFEKFKIIEVMRNNNNSICKFDCKTNLQTLEGKEIIKRLFI